MLVKSPAKINLHLRIGPLRPDGFHPLLSWMITIGLFDTLEIREIKTPGIKLTCDRADLPIDHTNLIIKAAQALASQIPHEKPGAEITLQKSIPMGGGLGGGSSNAAFTILALNRLWNLNWRAEKLASIGAKIGSDVPFFFHGPSSICASRGEIVVPTPPPRAAFAVLIFPGFPVSTAAAYRKFDQLAFATDLSQQSWTDWAKLSATELLPHLVNDLEAPAFAICPELGDLRRNLEAQLGRIVRMSGSGSTLFTLADKESEARQMVDKIGKLGIKTGAFELHPKMDDL
jgi:4-diphosphocytidyl-2-C-methyl-D-erythritol kinase